DAISELDKGWNLSTDGTSTAAVKAGDTVDIGVADGEGNLTATKTGNTIDFALNKDLVVDSVTAGDSVLNTDGLTITGGPSVTKSGIDAAGTKITNVAAGTVSSTSTDVVNGSQLNATNENVTAAQTAADAAQATADKGLNFSVNGGTADNVKLGETVNFANGKNTTATYDAVTNTYKYDVVDAPVFAGKLTANGLDANGEKITNVAAGADATDAVNVSQLEAASSAADGKTDELGQTA
ncbi:hypothetical protein EGU08_18730, partial [Acinetobacter baumannii]